MADSDSVKKAYEVSVCRISYGFINIRVEANSEKEAKEIALDQAGNHLFSEHDADYEANYVKEIND